MKKLGIILMACALIFGTTQCKKNDETNKPENNGESIFITLNVSCGTRANIVPEDDIAPVYYAEGDMIHVVSDGKYIGTLIYNGNNFDGDITNPTEGQPLHFYFFGNVTPNESLVVGETSICSVVISNQTTSHPVISYAPSTVNYNVGTTNYTATLLNKCALVKFNVTTVSENATCITGMNNKVTVDFETNEFEYSQEGEGVITLSAGDGEKWVILLPQDEVYQTEAYSADGIYTGTCASIPAVTENDYNVNGIAVAISHPMGAVNGLFTISANGDQVYFSKGNLQYISNVATPYWKFADNQWDYLGVTTGQNSDSENVDRDLFGWGTSGFDHGAVAYQPWATSTNYSHYYAYGNRQYHLYDQTGKADWGYNVIVNGGYLLHIWRTLTKEEWEYLFNGRNSARNKYGHGQINEVNGLILLPDNWTLPEGFNFISGNSNWANVYNTSQWDRMEAAGAVFLPTAGYRVGQEVGNVEISGYYWSSTNFNEYPADHARYLGFHSNTIYATYTDHRNYGYSVRLVQDY